MNIYAQNQMDEFFSTMKPKYLGPKFDFHCHIRLVEDIHGMIKYADQFNIKKILGIMWEDKKEEIAAEFPDLFVFAKFIDWRNVLEKNDIASALEYIEEDYSKGYSIAKIWFAPRWKDYVKENWNLQKSVSNFELDDPVLEPLFSKLEDLNMPLLLHVSDPDIIYPTKYQPESFYGIKSRHIKILENLLIRHPRLTIIGAHMGGQPEHLDHLGSLLDKFSNFYVDTGSAKWMVREFASQLEDAQSFFKKYSSRILFGTDISAGRQDREPLPGYYIHRYLSFQALWETDVKNLPLPIPDPDNDNKTHIFGLNLSDEILRDIYWNNANNLLDSL